jgi:hypothetical protein
VLYEMLTGARPFAADTPLAAMIKRLKEPPPPPRTLVGDIDPRWEAVILRCLERDPADRFASVQDVTRALEGDRVSAGLGGRARRRRRQWLAAGATALMLARRAGPWPYWVSGTSPARRTRPGCPRPSPRCSDPSWRPARRCA